MCISFCKIKIDGKKDFTKLCSPISVDMKFNGSLIMIFACVLKCFAF